MTASEEKVNHIKQYPEKHQHTFAELQKCCFVKGALDMMVMEAHSIYAPVGRNDSSKCDVTHGPCSCGAYH
jgi:hypothetical protein